MSKKQEALRRGLKTFFEDTSTEFADLEGRPLRRAPDREAGTETVVVADATVDVAGRAPADDTPPDVEPKPPRLHAETQLPRHEVRAAPASALEPPAPAAHATATLDVASITSRPGGGPAPVPAPPATKELAPEPQEATPSPTQRQAASGVAHDAPPPARRGQASAAGVQAQKPKPRAQAPVRRRPRPVVEIGADGVSPAQAHARKGVCFAYFLNHDCWRVPDAYCNSALQVCITRECPIYHLHKDAFERRFAKKFRHFW